MLLYRAAVASILMALNSSAFAQSQAPAKSTLPPSNSKPGSKPALKPAPVPAPNASSAGQSSTDRSPAEAGLDDADNVGEPEIVGQKGTGISAVFGLDLGMAFANSEHTEYESSKTGYSLSGKALLSLYVEKMILEAGPGWMFNRITGGPAKQLRRDDETGQDAQEGSEVVTQTAFAEFSARYRPSHRWQVGTAV